MMTNYRYDYLIEKKITEWRVTEIEEEKNMMTGKLCRRAANLSVVSFSNPLQQSAYHTA